MDVAIAVTAAQIMVAISNARHPSAARAQPPPRARTIRDRAVHGDPGAMAPRASSPQEVMARDPDRIRSSVREHSTCAASPRVKIPILPCVR
jgi:hypothetical protein